MLGEDKTAAPLELIRPICTRLLSLLQSTRCTLTARSFPLSREKKKKSRRSVSQIKNQDRREEQEEEEAYTTTITGSILWFLLFLSPSPIDTPALPSPLLLSTHTPITLSTHTHNHPHHRYSHSLTHSLTTPTLTATSPQSFKCPGIPRPAATIPIQTSGRQKKTVKISVGNRLKKKTLPRTTTGDNNGIRNNQHQYQDHLVSTILISSNIPSTPSNTISNTNTSNTILIILDSLPRLPRPLPRPNHTNNQPPVKERQLRADIAGDARFAVLASNLPQMAQAFVPAHAAFGRGAPGRSSQQMLYGAHGQPLPASYNLPPPPPPPPMDFHPPQQYPRPSSPGGSNRHPPPPTYNHQYDERMPIHDAASTERNRALELHPPLLPPPVSGNPGQSHSHPRRGSAGDYPNRYGRNDPPSPSSHLVPPHPAYSPPPPATGPPSTYQGQTYGQGPPPSIPGNYYPQAQSSVSNTSQQRPRSPVGYHSPGDRSSGSPHPFHPPMQYPPRPTSSGPNPSNPSNHPIPSMQLSNLIDPGPQSQITNRNNQRSAADGDMLDKLRPRAPT
ncbi:uncharacterized protein LAJ45_02383 [Morchella importuna]|uniref:uncharacterized protein n=1 Tax=Morchella importuna TaxID=1174673 RepID=UPI001E8D12A1|nr:uncharacterized protein LAJ45_02383 [Morchella importuna]KAH8153570.1 hypothetical protein LAJ45_02383 [Morchella importuna]